MGEYFINHFHWPDIHWCSVLNPEAQKYKENQMMLEKKIEVITYLYLYARETQV